MKTVQISKFKASCLEMLDQVQRTGEPLTITRRGEPVAIVHPAPRRGPRQFGCMRDSLVIHGDIVEPLGVPWETMQD